MKAVSLFSGIGGLDIAAHAAGIETVAFCEIEPFAVQVLERRFPAIENHGDITRFTNRRLRELGGSPFLRFKCPADYDGTIDVVHGGFPCQDLSVAGKQKGLSGERSGLWFEMLRVISELRPAYVLAENVRGACNLALPTVVSGLEGEGYEVRASVVPASAFGAPHRRERLFVLGVRRDVADSASERLQRLWTTREQESEIHAGESVPVCDSIGSGKLWPTPSVHGNYNRRGLSENSGDGLATAVKLCPTPTSTERSGVNPLTGGGGGLTHTVSLWRTPDANCMRGASSEERMKWKGEKGMPISINDQVDKGSLNPAWVEILMGFPLGWTDIDCDEPEPWPGWPMGLWAGNWPTPQCFDATAGDLKGKEYTGKNRHALKLGNCINSQTGQYSYEPPRTCAGIPNRAARLKALGNAVVPAQAFPFFYAISVIESSLLQDLIVAPGYQAQAA